MCKTGLGRGLLCVFFSSLGLISMEVCRCSASQFTKAPLGFGLSASHIKKCEAQCEPTSTKVRLCGRHLALTLGEEVKGEWEKQSGKHGDDGDGAEWRDGG